MATAKKQSVAVDTKRKVGTGAKVGIGAGLTAAAVAAAGAYFLYGSKDAAKNRKKVSGWVEDAKKEVVKGLEKAKSMSEAEYKELIDKVGKAHAELKKVSKADLASFQKEMKAGWKVIAKNAAKAATEVAAALPKKPVAKAGPAKKAVRVTPARAASTKAPAKKAVKK